MFSAGSIGVRRARRGERALLLSGLATLVLAAPLLAQSARIRVADDLGRPLAFESPPRRVVSLVPAATELIYALGAGRSVAGRTRWDDEPPEVLSVPSVGDAIGASAEKVVSLRPDLVVAVAGPDDARTIAEMERLGLPVLAVRLNDLADLDRVLTLLGTVLGRSETADSLRASLHAQLEDVRRSVAHLPVRSVYYDVAWPPAITVGSGSYLTELLAVAGARNVFADLRAPSPRVSVEAIAERDPDLVLLPSGPGAVAPDARQGWSAIRAVREGAVVEVDAGLLHRLGPRVGEAARALARAVHPGLEAGTAAGREGP